MPRGNPWEQCRLSSSTSMFAAGAPRSGNAGSYGFWRGRSRLPWPWSRRGGSPCSVGATASAAWPSWQEALTAALRDLGVDGGPIGVELAGLGTTVDRRRLHGCPAQDRKSATARASFEFSGQSRRRPRDRSPTNRRRRPPSPRPGVRSKTRRRAQVFDELAARFRALLAESGAEMDHFAYSPGGCGHRHALGHLGLDGEITYLDYGCVRELARSDSGLTVALRPPRPRPADEMLPRRLSMRSTRAPGVPSAGRAGLYRLGGDAFVVDRAGPRPSSPQGQRAIGLEARSTR